MKEKKECPREDSSLRLHGIVSPQRDDLTTNRQGPKAKATLALHSRHAFPFLHHNSSTSIGMITTLIECAALVSGAMITDKDALQDPPRGLIEAASVYPDLFFRENTDELFFFLE